MQKDDGAGWGGSVVKRVLTEKVIFEQRVEGAEEERSHVNLSGKCFPGEVKAGAVVLKMGCVTKLLKNSKEAGGRSPGRVSKGRQHAGEQQGSRASGLLRALGPRGTGRI